MVNFMQKPFKKKVLIIFVHLCLAVLAIFWLIPILWVILTSFKGTLGSYSATFFQLLILCKITSCYLRISVHLIFLKCC